MKRIGRYLAGKPRAVCLFRWRKGELKAYADAEWSGDRTARRSVSAGVIMRDEHCLNVWTKKQQVVSLSTAESDFFRGSQDRIGRTGDSELGQRTWG